MKDNENLLFDSIDLFRDDEYSKVTEIHHTEDKKKDIAVIGIAGTFSEADDVEQLWNNIRLRKDCIREIPLGRKKDYEKLVSGFLGTTICKNQDEYAKSGYLDHIDEFDYSYFSISPKEAKYIDPNHRLFLQCSIQAIEDAGYRLDDLKGSRTGVFLGYSNDSGIEYRDIIGGNKAEVSDLAMTGNIRSVIASRLSYILDFHGPSILVDTACSSSLVAIHMACCAIRNGECDMAISGGVNVQINQFSKDDTSIDIVSPDFRAKTFDDDANGTGLGEGVGTVVLKSLEKAIEDGDHIYAVVKGSAVNQDGKSNGITAPNGKAQDDLLVDAWSDAQVLPESISLIEAHGTGTKLGDAVELESINAAFSKYTSKKQFCAIGSLKTNIGHLGNAAGIASFIKCILALKYKILPPTINFVKPNKKMNFIESPIYINDVAIDWEANEFPRRCGVSSFGLSGTNCHIILEEYEDKQVQNTPRKDECNDEKNILLLSASTKNTLMQLVLKYYNFLNSEPNIPMKDFCFTNNVGRTFKKYRIAILFCSLQDILQKLYSIKEKNVESIEQSDVWYGETEMQNKMSTTENEWRSVEEAALLFAKGIPVNLNRLYENSTAKKISIPVNIFEKNRCWLDNTQVSNKLSALVDRVVAKTKNFDVYETSLSVSNYWVLKEHRVINNYVLPGTAYLNIIGDIMNTMCPDNSELIFEDFMFLHPFMINEDEERTLQFIVKKLQDHYEVEAQSQLKDSDIWDTHSQAKIRVDFEKKQVRQYDIELLLNHNQMESVAGYRPSKDAPVQTGEHWNCMQKIYYNEDRVVAYFELPDQFKAEMLNYTLHPSLLDCAVNIPIAYIKADVFLPLSYRKFTLFGTMPDKFYSVLKINPNEFSTIKETITFDIKLLDTSGVAFAEVENYVLKRVRLDEFKYPTLNNKQLLKQIYWEEAVVKKDLLACPKLTILFVKDDNSYSKQMTSILKSMSSTYVVVKIGNNFEKISEYKYCISNKKEDYDQLFCDIDLGNCSQIIHATSLNDVNYDIMDDTLDREEDILSLYYLTNALVEYRKREVIELIVISSNGFQIPNCEVVVDPFHSSLYHFAKVISSEYNNIHCRCIDIDDENELVDVMNDLKYEAEEFIVAYRQNRTYIQKLCSMEEKPYSKRTVHIQNDGCYVITGGTGGLGLTQALHISKKAKVHFVLISRTGLPQQDNWDDIIANGKEIKLIQRIQIAKEITNNGSTIDCVNADVSNTKEMENAFVEIRNRYKRINGVIHAAGIPSDKYIFRTTKEELLSVFNVKALGSINLLKFVKEPLDFFICFSSVASLEGGPGQAGYVAANSFLDSFVYCIPENQHGISICWAPWKEVGMAYDGGTIEKGSLFNPLLSDDAELALDFVLDSNLKNVLIGQLNMENAEQLFQSKIYYRLNNVIEKYLFKKANSRIKHSEKHTEFDIQSISKSEYSLENIRKIIKTLWMNLLEMENVSLDSSFTSLGGNSIFAVYLLGELDKYFTGVLGIADIFTYATINQMSDYIYSFYQQDKEEDLHLETEKESEIDGRMDEILNKLANGELSIEETNDLMEGF